MPDIGAEVYEPKVLVERKYRGDIYEGGEHIKARVDANFKEEANKLVSQLNESKARTNKARSAQAKAEKSLARFKGLESIAKLPKEHKDHLVGLADLKHKELKVEAENKAAREKVSRMFDEARKKLSTERDPTPPSKSKSKDNGMEM